jgi:hypothetical protein
MSELLEQAAAALGLPPALVQRSAAARASETGAEVDEILAAWAGEAPAPAAAPEEEAEPETDEAPEVEAEEPEPEEAEVPAPAAHPEVVVEVPESVPLPAGGGAAFAAAAEPPVLVGASDSPIAILVGVVGLFLVAVLVGLVGPALASDAPGARSSEIPYSELALEGQSIYTSLGCAFCHTQMVRAVVADVGLGAVTLKDTNQVLGMRRFGPDLSDAGSRLTATQIEATVGGFGGHPPHILAPDDVTALVAYLSESTTSREQPESEDGGIEEEPGG